MRIKTTIIAFIASMFGSVATAAELVHQFNSPAFNGVGYSSHVLTIEQLETQRKQSTDRDWKRVVNKFREQSISVSQSVNQSKGEAS